MASFRELLAQTKAKIPRSTPPTAEAAPRRRDVPRRPRARRVRAGHDPRRGLHPARPPREPGREQAPRQGHAGRRLLRRRHPLRVRGQDAAGARLHRRRLDDRRLRPVEERGPAVDHARPSLTPEQRNRYNRHILLPEVGEAGQQKLLESKVLLLGAGGLGSPAALYLAAAGVGTLGIVDMDVVDASNLQRQILHNMDRIGERKVDSREEDAHRAQPRRRTSSPTTCASAPTTCSTSSTATTSSLDGTDNFPTRYLLNDASLLKRIPVVHGSIFRFEGQVTVFKPYEGPCYRCLLPEPPPPELAPCCAEAGVLGVLPGIIGSIQALETIKLAPRPRRPAHRPAARVRRARGDASAPSRCAATRRARPAARTRRRS